MHINRFSPTNTVRRLRQATARRPERDDIHSACCNVFPPALATLVLVQSVARDGLKTILALAIVLAVFGALAAALVWWPGAQTDDQVGQDPPAQENEPSPTTRVAPAEVPAWWNGAPPAAPLLHDKPVEK